MQHHFHRPAILAGILGFVVLLTAAAQALKFPGGTFRATDPENNKIAITFDSAGALNVFVNDQSFAQSTWQVKADTITFGTVTGTEGSVCATSAKYLWAFKDNRLSFTGVGTDDCAQRRDPLLGLTWTKG